MKKPLTFEQHIQNVSKRKEELPFHKMDDVSRRKFLQSLGYFLTAMSVPTMVRLDTLSSISKKIFGSSLAFAQTGSFASKPIVCKIITRLGYAFNQWVLGCYTANTNATFARQNTPWMNSYYNANPAIATTVGNGLPVFLPPPSRGLLSPYVNGIQNFSSIQGFGPHDAHFRKSWSTGKGNMTMWRAKTEIDSGSNTVISSPFAFGDAEIVPDYFDAPANLQPYKTTPYNNIANIYNQFSTPQFLTNQGTNISAGLRSQLLAVSGNKFAEDIAKSLYKKNSEQLLAANAQSLQILATNYRDALNPSHPDNAATMAMLNASLPAPTRIECAVNIPQSIFVGMQAANLGITPRIFEILIYTNDWHIDTQLPSATQATWEATDRYRSARYLSQVIANTFTAINSGAWINSVTGQNEILDFTHDSEFTRGLHIGQDDEGGLDNPDNFLNAQCIISSNNTTNVRFKPGSFGGPDNAFYPYMEYNAATNVHASGYSGLASAYTDEQGMWLMAKLLGVNLADFGITGTGTIPNMVF
jgi:hypothetical protein